MPTRPITYATQLGISLAEMEAAKQIMLDQGFLAQAILGTTTQLDGFTCTPNSPADLTVNVSSGSIFKYQNVDDTAFGQLPSQIPADTTHQIVKYATKLDITSFSITPPTTSGFSRNDLIQINFQEADGDPENIPFWNGTSNGIPNPPIFQNLNTKRIDSVVISIKNGTPATTGTQTTPTPDPGYTGAWVVTTANGQTTITSGNITQYTNAPFISEKLKDKISQAFADARYALLQNVALDKSYFKGFQITNNAGDTNHDIDFGIGECRDSTGGVLIALNSTLTKRIDAAWAAGNNQGGLFSGSVAASTNYHLFVIKKDSDGTIDAGFDTSLTAANRPAGYTSYRRVATLYTDGSSNLVQISNRADEFLLKVPVADYIQNNPGTSAILATLSVPSGIQVEAKCSINLSNIASGGGEYFLLVTSPDQTDTIPSSSIFTSKNAIGDEVQLNNTVTDPWRTNTSKQIRLRMDTSDTSLTLTVITHGWIDDRGRFN